MTLGRKIIELQDTNSTNRYAADLIKKGKIKAGTIIFTDFQSNGKGHSGSFWESNSGENLLFSLILFPNFISAERHFYLSKFISIGICKFVRSFVSNSFIKWPNDIMCNGKKICGTLIENVIEQSWIKSSVIGIGLNVNQDKFNGNFIATSLSLETGEQKEIKKMLKLLIKFLNTEYERLLNQKYDEIDREYIQLLYRYQEWANYRKKNEVFEGRITGISNFGELIIEDRLGKESKFGFKEVVFL